MRSVAFVVLWLGLLTSFAVAEKRVALVIGNSDYGVGQSLPNPINDATKISSLLADLLRFRVISAVDADREGMNRALTEFGRAAANADVAVFFYAGHGVELDGINYLLPVRADIRTDVDLISQAFRIDQVTDTMVRADVKTKIVLIDACRNNPLPTIAVRGAKSIGLKAFYASNIDTLVAFATQPGQVAYDGTTGNSPFTTALIDYLGQPDLEVRHMLVRVRQAVAAATENRQFPWWDDLIMAEVYLGGQGGVPVNLLQPDQKRHANTPKTVDPADIALCNSISDTSGTILLRAYLDRYPDGLCASLVRKHLGLVSTAVVAPEPEPNPPAPSEPNGPKIVALDAPNDMATRAGSDVYRVSSYWYHNGSVMALAAQGDQRAFYYEEPKALLAKAGASRGTLLFKGEFAKMRYEGISFLFSKECGPIPYPVSGRVSKDYRRVVLTGRKPIRDSNCRQISSKPERLVFTLRE